VYARLFRKATETRRFTIRDAGTGGWEVVDQKDSTVLKNVRYSDWHRVERARAAFAVEASMLRDAGWTES
jgi:hypothetical protein